MSNYPITITNPVIKTGQKNIIYVGSESPNTLDIAISNDSGLNVTFDTSISFNLTFPSQIISETNVKNISFGDDWTKPTVQLPGTGTNDPYTLTSSPTKKISFDSGDTFTLTLSEIVPTAANNGPITLKYQFSDGPPMATSGTVVANAVPNPDYQILMGPNHPLEVSVTVTGNSQGTSQTSRIEPSALPLTGELQKDNAVYNSAKVTFAFKGQNNRPKSHDGYDPTKVLVDSLGTKTPILEVRFPYLHAEDEIDDTFALTDNSYNEKDPSKTPITSGRNIAVSLDPNSIKSSNSYWEIKTEEGNAITAPVWQISPLTSNPHMFTSVDFGDGPNASGPFLTLYISNICTTLPIALTTPETVAFIQSKLVPGFNDQMLVPTIERDPEQRLKSFSAEVTPDRTQVLLKWQTQNATSATIAGIDPPATQTSPLNPTGSVLSTVSINTPLLSEYELVSICSYRNNSETDTGSGKVKAVWVMNEILGDSGVGHLSSLCASADGSSIYMPAYGMDTHTQIYQMSCDTLDETAKTAFSGDFDPVNVAASPDGNSLYAVLKSQDVTPNNVMAMEIVKLATSDLTTVVQTYTGLPSMHQMANGGGLATTPNSGFVVYSNYLPEDTPTIYYLDTSADWSSYTPKSLAVPTLNDRGLAVSSESIFFSDSGGLGHIGINPSFGTTATVIPLSYMGSNYQAGPMCLSQDGSQLAIWASHGRDYRIFFLRTNNLTVETLTIPTNLSNARYRGYLPDITYSVDGRCVFVSGVAQGTKGLIYAFNVADGSQRGDTIIQGASGFSEIVAQPNGLGIFALTIDANAQGGLIRLDPQFATFENPPT